MKLTDAKFVKRIKTGEYEHEEYVLGANLDDGDNGSEALLSMKGEVEAAIAGESSSASGQAAPGKKKKPKAGKKPAKQEDEDESASDDESAEDPNEDSDDEGAESGEDGDGADADDSSDGDDSDAEEDADGEAEEDEKPAKKGSKGSKPAAESKGKKGFKKKPQKYARSLEAHKEIFSAILKEVAPNWKKTDASKALAKSVSQKLEGKDFLDDNGEVASDFKALVKKHMASKK